MDLEALIILTLIIIGIVWALWLIFKRDLMGNQVVKVLSYFLGVIITLLVVLGMVSWFLPWWATKLMQNTSSSPQVQTLQEVSTNLWNDLSDGNISVTSEPEQPNNNITPAPDTSPLAPPQSQGLSLPGCGSRKITVAAGDTLYAISRRYGTTVDALKQCNNLDSNLIKVGQQLIVP